MRKALIAVMLSLACAVSVAQNAPEKKAAPAGPRNIATIASSSPLYEVQIMFRSGSADDPAGKEGTAMLVSDALVEGGFGDPKNPVTKEKLAEITRPWGDAAMPRIRVDKQATTLSVTVPKDAWPKYVAQVLKPMLQQPLFEAKEIERLRKEALVGIQSSLRFEQQEMLGLMTLDNWVLGGPLGHLGSGTVKGLQAVTREDVVSFQRANYTTANALIATTITDKNDLALLTSAVPNSQEIFENNGRNNISPEEIRLFIKERNSRYVPPAVQGRSILIITQPNALATGIHLGYPIAVTRANPDYWPLFVANTFLGAHRDDFARLYQEFREDRGYNYGDYSYIEYLAARPYSLFPPPTTPRTQQYFSMWIRPVGNQYSHFILKATVSELERFIREGLTPEQVAQSKVKARTLYLNYAESKGRQLGYKLDDMFYGMSDRGYLDTMLKSIDAVTPEQVNAAIRKYLQPENLKIVLTTNEKFASQLADDIATNANVQNKTLEEYHISEQVPPEKKVLLDQDEQWKKYPLNIKRADIHIVNADQMFETVEVPGLASK